MRSESVSDVYADRGNLDIGGEEDAGMLAWVMWDVVIFEELLT